MFELAKKLGTEGEQDPSLLHPLFARLPPLYPDTPEQSTPTPTDIEPGDDPNPYEPIPLSVLFFLSDELMAKFPWDGEVVRGKEIMGEGSVVSSYALEMAARNGITWNLSDALNLIDRDVVKPGAGMADDDDEAEFKAPVRRRQVRPLNIPRNMFGTTMAVSIVMFGLGMAIYGVRAGGPRSDWTSFWAVVVRSWVEKTDKAVGLSERVCQGILV